jgi:hypothetical protein
MTNRPDYHITYTAHKNRRMAFRAQLESETFSLLYQGVFYPCLSISNQGCLIEGTLDSALEVINAEIFYEKIKIGEIKGRIVRSQDEEMMALHFISISRETKAFIEEYVLSLQKEELKIASIEKRKVEESRLLQAEEKYNN